MLNIISRSIVSTHTRGPRKVVTNLLKGLDELGYPYVINAAPDATDTLWIHDDSAALEAAISLPGERAIIAGPNIYTLPSEVPSSVIDNKVLFLQPAVWVENFWETFSETKMNTAVWPVGIDTKKFSPNPTTKKDLILVYNKQRSEVDTEAVCATLDAHKERYEVLTYGRYTENEYQELLQRAKALVWIGRSESQGIGLLEALAMDVPVLLWDITKLGEFIDANVSGFSTAQLAFGPVTAAPYFDKRCGTRFVDRKDLASAVENFLDSLPGYNPRSYVNSELSLRKQAVAFLDLFKTHFGTTEKQLKNTALSSTKKWRNGKLFFKLTSICKDAIRQIIR